MTSNPSKDRGRVVHCKKEKFDVYIGRPGYFGNPFVLHREQDRESVVHRYELYARKRMIEDIEFEKKIKDLYGKTLGCYCAPRLCHGDILLKIAEELQ